jgi:hypothetical protein
MQRNKRKEKGRKEKKNNQIDINICHVIAGFQVHVSHPLCLLVDKVLRELREFRVVREQVVQELKALEVPRAHQVQTQSMYKLLVRKVV